MYNIRYHIASLVAVFLALSVGLVLGSIVVERGTIGRQQDALVKSLQTDFVRINAENKTLSSRLDATEEFAGALVPGVTDRLLADKTILVLTNSGRADGLSSATDAIQHAGGQVAVGMVEQQGFGLDDEKVISAVQSVIGTTDEGDELARSVAASLTAEWASPGPRPVTATLVDARVLRVDDLPSDTAVDGVVVLTSWDGESDKATMDLAAAMRDHAVLVIGAQANATSSNVAEVFAAEGFGAVDDLGTPRGEYSLAVLLARHALGHYGAGPTADAPFPPLPAQAGK